MFKRAVYHTSRQLAVELFVWGGIWCHPDQAHLTPHLCFLRLSKLQPDMPIKRRMIATLAFPCTHFTLKDRNSKFAPTNSLLHPCIHRPGSCRILSVCHRAHHSLRPIMQIAHISQLKFWSASDNTYNIHQTTLLIFIKSLFFAYPTRDELWCLYMHT